jgi:hypothetical protein
VKTWDVESVMGVLGGNSGLFLGVSACTIMEWLEFITMAVWTYSTAWVVCGSQVAPVAPEPSHGKVPGDNEPSEVTVVNRYSDAAP